MSHRMLLAIGAPPSQLISQFFPIRTAHRTDAKERAESGSLAAVPLAAPLVHALVVPTVALAPEAIPTKIGFGAGAGGVALPLPAAPERRDPAAAAGPAAGGGGPRLEGPAAAASRYQHLAYWKQPQIAVVAVARELVGFLWAVMRDLPTPEATAA